MTALERLARQIIGDASFDAIAKGQGIQNAVRTAEVRLYAEQHQERAKWAKMKSESASSVG